MTANRPRLVTTGLWLVFAASLAGMTCFNLLFSVVPLYVGSFGASGGVGAGLSTFALMASSVAGELVVARVFARLGYRYVFAGGLVLLGVPALALIGSHRMTVIIAVAVVRGLGFAIVVVGGGTLVASLAPAARRGEALGLYGAVVGGSAVVALPLGIWLVSRIGYGPVFVTAAVAALAGVAATLRLPVRVEVPDSVPADRVGIVASLRDPALARPAVAFCVVAAGGGVVTTFLPLALTGSALLAAVALLIQSVAATTLRWWAGRYGDRRGPARLLAPSLLVSAVGIGLFTLVPNPVAALAGATVFGVGYGVAQNVSMATMFARGNRSGYDAISAMWNIAYDAGLGLGAAGFGFLSVHTGYPWAFAATALTIAPIAILAARPHSPGGAVSRRSSSS